MTVGVAEASGAVLASAELYDPTTGTFTATGSMTSPREAHTATPYSNGKVLIAGGIISGGSTTNSAELYESATGKFTATGEMMSPRANHTASFLTNGSNKTIIAGGTNGGQVLSSAEAYNLATGKFEPTGSMTSLRYGHTATVVNPVQVLITGGILGGEVENHRTASADLWASEFFHPAGSMSSPRADHTATLFSNGKVLIAGGTSNTEALSSAELWDPTTGKFAPTGSMKEARYSYTATLLGNDKVLVAGGFTSISSNATTASAELYDPTTGKFEPTGSMSSPRADHTATVLGNGKVLIAGGTTSTEAVTSAELYDPTTGKFEPTGSMKEARAEYTASVLTNGQVLAAGGTTVVPVNVPPPLPAPHFYKNRFKLPEESGGPGAEGTDFMSWGALVLETKTIGTITCLTESGGDVYNPTTSPFPGGAGEGRIDGWLAYDCTNELCEATFKSKQEILPEGLENFGEWEAKLVEPVAGKIRLQLGNSVKESPTQIKLRAHCPPNGHGEINANIKGEVSPLVENGTGIGGVAASKLRFDAESGELEVSSVKEAKVAASPKLMGYEGGELISTKNP
jgi:hypothetical protein